MTGYRTIRQAGRAELVEKRSRFIGQSFPVSTEEEVTAILGKLRKKYHDAAHNCWAYRLSPNGSLTRYSDDGEPGGTAGLPILGAITGRDLTDVLVVVTRYFGGVLLGTGGLTRAYGKTAGMALEDAGVCRMLPAVVFAIRLEYPQYNRAAGLLSKEGAVILDTLFEADVLIRGVIPAQEYESFALALIDATDGAAQLKKDGERLFSF